MNPEDPIDWNRLESVRGEPNLRAVFDEHREEATEAETAQGAIDYLKEVAHEEGVVSRDQGAAFVFAYLLEKEAGWDLEDGVAANASDVPGSLVARRPDADDLERLFWEEGRVPWWQAVAFGVHYTLVIYWMWEEDIPLMRQNLTDEQFERLDSGE